MKIRCLAIGLGLFLMTPSASFSEVLTFNYEAAGSGGAMVTGTFGYDTTTPDSSPSVFFAEYLTGFINGVVSGGPADGFAFDYQMSGGTAPGDLRVAVGANPFFSIFWIRQFADVGEIEIINMDSSFSGPVFDDTSLPTEFDVDDWPTRYLFTAGDIFQLTSIQVVPIPPALWLFGSGLLGLVGIARRKKAA